MRHPVLFFSVGILALICVPLQVVTAASGRESASFLDIPVGAGPAALGSAYSAMANNAYAPVWNPAGLGFLDAPEVSAQHLSYVDSIHYEFLSGVYPLSDVHGLGVSIQYLGTGDIAGMDENATPIGDYSSHYASYALSYGRVLMPRLSAGITAKAIEAKISDVSAHAFAADAGLLFKPNSRWSLAAVLANAGTEPTFLDSKDPLPLAFRVGGAYRISSQWLFSTEGRWRREGPASGHVGVQWDPSTFFGFRAGYRSDTVKELSALAGFSTGAAIRLGTSELAYAWLPLGDLGDTHYFSFNMKFYGRTNAKPRNLIYLPTPGRHFVRHSSPASRAYAPAVTPSRNNYLDEDELLEQLAIEMGIRGVASR